LDIYSTLDFMVAINIQQQKKGKWNCREENPCVLIEILLEDSKTRR